MKRDRAPSLDARRLRAEGKSDRECPPSAHAVSDKVEAAYRRGDLFDKRRRLFDEWAAYCCSPPRAAGELVALRSPT